MPARRPNPDDVAYVTEVTRALDAGQGDRPVEGDHRARIDLRQHVVQSEDLPPVGRLGAHSFVVHRSDRCLQLIGTKWP